MAQTKLITSVEHNKRSFNGKYGTLYVHHIKFEGDPNTWEYNSQKAVCEFFKANEQATFETNISSRTTASGTFTDYRIKPLEQQGSGGGTPGPGKPKEVKDQGMIAYESCFASACTFYAGKQVTEETVFAMAAKAFNEAKSRSTQ